MKRLTLRVGYIPLFFECYCRNCVCECILILPHLYAHGPLQMSLMLSNTQNGIYCTRLSVISGSQNISGFFDWHEDPLAPLFIPLWSYSLMKICWATTWGSRFGIVNNHVFVLHIDHTHICRRLMLSIHSHLRPHLCSSTLWTTFISIYGRSHFTRARTIIDFQSPHSVCLLQSAREGIAV